MSNRHWRLLNPRQHSRPIFWFALVSVFLITLTSCDEYSQPQNVILNETFGPEISGEWHLEGDETSRAMIANNRLLLEVDSANTLQFSTLAAPVIDDFIVEVEAILEAGKLESSYGILFRMQGLDQFYRFDITGNGQYIVERRNADGTWTRLTNGWQSDNAINTGNMASNKLRVEVVGSDISVYANETLLVQVTDDAYSVGTIALDAGTFSQTNLKVGFDNLTIAE